MCNQQVKEIPVLLWSKIVCLDMRKGRNIWIHAKGSPLVKSAKDTFGFVSSEKNFSVMKCIVLKNFHAFHMHEIRAHWFCVCVLPIPKELDFSQVHILRKVNDSIKAVYYNYFVLRMLLSLILFEIYLNASRFNPDTSERR